MTMKTAMNLFEGELFVSRAPSHSHQRVIANLMTLSRNYFERACHQSLCLVMMTVIFCLLPVTADAQDKRICSTTVLSNQSPQERAYALGDLLMTTELFDLYGRLGYPNDCWCSYSSVNVVVVYKADENYKIEDNEEYKNKVEDVIVPFVRSKCGNFKALSVTHHIKGYYINILGEVLKEDDVPRFLAGSPNSYSFAHLHHSYYNDAGTLKRTLDSYGSISGRRQRLSDEKVRAEQRKAEAQRTAEEARKTSIERRRPIHRKLAADVLKIMNLPSAKNPPATYDFSGYKNKFYWENIYTGNFKPFTDKYEEAEDYAKATAKAMADSNAADLYNLANLRSDIMAANFAYHRAYEDICQANKEITWLKIPLTIPARDIRDGFANIIGRTQETTDDYYIREPFVERVRANFGYMTNPNRAVSDYTYKQYKDELTNFITTERCSSPALRQFEVNLYLAEKWFLPLQELYQPEEMREQNTRMPAGNPSTPEPAIKPIKKRPRKKP